MSVLTRLERILRTNAFGLEPQITTSKLMYIFQRHHYAFLSLPNIHAVTLIYIIWFCLEGTFIVLFRYFCSIAFVGILLAAKTKRYPTY